MTLFICSPYILFLLTAYCHRNTPRGRRPGPQVPATFRQRSQRGSSPLKGYKPRTGPAKKQRRPAAADPLGVVKLVSRARQADRKPGRGHGVEHVLNREARGVAGIRVVLQVDRALHLMEDVRRERQRVMGPVEGHMLVVMHQVLD